MNSKLKGSDFGSDNELFVEFKKCLLHCLIKCYETLWNFNHFKLLNLLMLKFIRYPECKSTLSLFLQSRNIAILPAKFRIVTDIGHLIR